MNKGIVVEYIDQQKIICAVVLNRKKDKLNLLNENNREVSFSQKRLSHVSDDSLDPDLDRNSMAARLKQIAQKRDRLSEVINIKELWEILNEESDDIDLDAMTLFCFDPPLCSDHESAVIRAFFRDKLYFKFSRNCFKPYTPEQVETRKKQIQEARKKELLLKKAVAWINEVQGAKNGSIPPADPEITDILTSYYLFNNESDSWLLARQIVKKSGLGSPDQLFNIFVKAGIWDQNKNTDLIVLNIPTHFPADAVQQEKKLTSSDPGFFDDRLRKDLTDVPLITIDGQSTLDYDDAISLENTENGYRLGIHIIDVDAYVKSGDPIDLAARDRASSIYMPDDKLPMLPATLSEDLCSLKENEIRPGISTIINLNRFFEIQDYTVIPSIIKVHSQLSYTEANILNGKDDPVTTLYRIATILREKRLKAGAVQITLPEVNVWLEENQEIGYLKIDRENPSRMLVSEMMIFANSLMAEFLSHHKMPAVFRSQAEPRQRLFKGIETSLILNFMQRKQLSRAIIGTEPEAHSGLGVKAYTTATSPIRRYHDLLTQRQIKAVFGYNRPYSKTELEEILQSIAMSVANAGKIQAARKRYWLVKYLESKKGCTYEALVIDSYKDYYNVLIKEFMLEAKLPSGGMKLRPGDIIQVTIQHADARKGLLSLFV